MTLRRSCLSALLAAFILNAQPPTYPRAPGPVGPKPVGRSEWRIANIVELNQFFKWQVGVPSDAFRGLTFADAIVKVDNLALPYVEGFDSQWVSPEIRRNFDYNLTAADLSAVKARLRAFRIQMPAYHVVDLSREPRKVFEFAKALGVQAIVCSAVPSNLPEVDTLADEFGIDVALAMPPQKLKGLGKRIGLELMSANAIPPDVLTVLKDRPISVSAPEGMPAKGFLQALYGLGPKPIFFGLRTGRSLDESVGLSHAVDNFEDAALPVLGAYMVARSKTLEIRGASELSAEVQRKIEGAIPPAAPATPAHPRRLLVMDEHQGHAPIPLANYAFELMGRNTGAWQTVFSNDLDNLKYDRIRQFDAVMLNSSESDISADPAVREGLLRFVREGGGLGGIHAAAWSAAFWPEFMEMMGASQGNHRVQPATVKIDDPLSPLTKSFAGQAFTYTDEYYRMADTGPQGTYYSRDKVHVLLSVDLDRSADFNTGRVPFLRQDKDYAVAWIKGYGKGRVFYDCMGHTPEMFYDRNMNQFLLAAIQFLLGDLPADTTPSAFIGAVH